MFPLASIKWLFSVPCCCVLPEDLISGLAMKRKTVALGWGAIERQQFIAEEIKKFEAAGLVRGVQHPT